MPLNTKANDLWKWQTRLVVKDTSAAIRRISEAGYQVISSVVSAIPNGKLGFNKGVIVHDPDGHSLQLVEQ